MRHFVPLASGSLRENQDWKAFFNKVYRFHNSLERLSGIISVHHNTSYILDALSVQRNVSEILSGYKSKLHSIKNSTVNYNVCIALMIWHIYYRPLLRQIFSALHLDFNSQPAAKQLTPCAGWLKYVFTLCFKILSGSCLIYELSWFFEKLKCV